MQGKIISYNPGSRSAKVLAEALGIKRIKHEGKKLLVVGHLINWGCSVFPPRIVVHPGARIWNNPDIIKKASNKLEAFKTLQGSVPLPKWTESREEASKWLPELVVCRTVLNGHSGNGIVLADSQDKLVAAPLYTEYIKKETEYRIHASQKEAFFVQRKARKMDVPDDQVDWQIRNHKNGFIYANKDVQVPEQFKEIAVQAVTKLGLDFGAVDLIVTKKGNPFVLEVNTAPGLEGTTLEKYVEQLSSMCVRKL